MSFLPPEMPHLWQAALIIFTSFFGSALTAAFSIGGGLLLIAVMSSVMPAIAVVPVHGAVMVGSNAGRASILFRHIDWPILGWFAIGAVIGASIGSQVVTNLPAWAFRFAIAAFIIFTQWGPKFRNLGFGPRSYIVAGGISSFLTLFVGATGPFISTILSKVPGMVRQGLIASSGACMTLQHGLKVIVFFLAGFIYAPWIPLIAAALVSGFCGTLLGTKLLGNLSEAVFRKLLKWLLTAMAVYLLTLAAIEVLSL
ncbi:sulfite exporter TauE/SafE family protein [Parvularcula sp. IMCC14364]|uniref:sulfite exporter TauE/SafE family protein n=1 Tax=Parvularcula sp. IMCC14364 TaxID=3067902 RepID=UPI00274148FE|nr:sulfite exporter TauE/SafE family protein [Parvularcula sp. IMCC14364]